jgi:hypothetical protein
MSATLDAIDTEGGKQTFATQSAEVCYADEAGFRVTNSIVCFGNDIEPTSS